MKISESINAVMAISAREAIRRNFPEINPEHLMLGLLTFAKVPSEELQRLLIAPEAKGLLGEEIAELMVDLGKYDLLDPAFPDRLKEAMGSGNQAFRGERLHRSSESRRVFETGMDLARKDSPRVFRPVHLLRALLSSPSPVLAGLLPGQPDLETLLKGGGAQKPPAVHGAKPNSEVGSSEKVPASGESSPGEDHLSGLTRRLRTLKSDLLSRIFGQEHAVQAFVDGLFNAEITAAVDSERRAPRALFVFAGPPGVGKTFLAESGAKALGRPFKRFDMSAFSGHHQNEALVGIPKNFQGAHPGSLTGFVAKNPGAVLLFDEIEKAHLNTIHYFLQVLDAGTLEDKFHEKTVEFRDTTVIFTTNVGRKLYENPDRCGINRSNAAFHRKTIIDALASEVNPNTREPFFPEAICSRMATGFPVLFNHLGINELTRVAAGELARTADLLSRQLGKRVDIDGLLPLLLVLKEGGRTDARTLRAQTTSFLKAEIFKVSRLFSGDGLAEAMKSIDSIGFGIDAAPAGKDAGPDGNDPAALAILESPQKPKVLVVADEGLCALLGKNLTSVEWRFAQTVESALAIGSEEQPDFAVVDLWTGRTSRDLLGTVAQFDFVPPAARSLDRGQELLRKLHERLPGLPVVLLISQEPGKKGMGEELLSVCLRAGGAREAVTLGAAQGQPGSPESFEALGKDLQDIALRIAREKTAENLGRERKILSFDTAPKIFPESRSLRIRLRNLRINRAVASVDAGEILEEVERPGTRFEDVIGADSAKEELKFFIDYLKSPRRFLALGLKPPKGVLLYGPPGTGKTMLARAMAGESDVAFIPAVASSFVTMWQGSGPESVRTLFARARRYAPSIVFIDEIDAVGKTRTGGPGGHGEEMALNALLTEMDGFSGNKPDRPVFVLAATNFKVDGDEAGKGGSTRALDPALVRRFSRSILVDLPDTAARRRFLEIRLGEAGEKMVTPGAIDLLAEKSVGMSVANLEQVLELAGRVAFKKGVPVSDELLIEALDSIREGEAKEWAPDLLEGTAWHEAGHTVMYWLEGWLSPEVSIVARASRGGGMRRSADEMKRENRTRADLLAGISTALGGRAAEIVRFGPEGGLSSGASGDLEFASDIARQMVCRFGMDKKFGLAAMGDLLRRPEAIGTPLYKEVQERVNEILTEQMEETLARLKEFRPKLEAVAKELMRKNRLQKTDIEAILGSPKSGRASDHGD